MACPKCGCRTTYQYDDGDDCGQSDDSLERCAACGEVFDIEGHADEDDDIETQPGAPGFDGASAWNAHADRIEQLERDNAALRAVLKDVKTARDGHYWTADLDAKISTALSQTKRKA